MKSHVVWMLLVCGLARVTPSWAHGDLHGQILELTKQIEQEPRNAQLFLRRGELHRTHLDWDAAQADYHRAAVLDPRMDLLDLARGRMFFEANWPQSAKVALDHFLEKHPDHVEGLITRARVLVKLKQSAEAVADYTRALAKTTEPKPEIYLERAQTIAEESSANYAAALKGLDEGIEKLGPLVTLQLYAIDLELKRKQYDLALQRLDRVAAQSPRKESWLERRGQILKQAGRESEAREAFRAALKALDHLPPSRRHVPAMVELEKRLRRALESAEAGGGK